MKKLYILLFIITLIVLYVCFAPVKIPVLTYHDFVDGEPTNNMQISKKAFEEEMKYLVRYLLAWSFSLTLPLTFCGEL